ncbi:unnamed protein product [Brassicogethes aeneus]|uniref:Thioredoxin domain-containing protein n=1 Tax=Brassicogethes aeneus TaxID=1431903 RepID=A0A9P0BJB2_BRAAE|nr:unnamed protein product [Brassicogethes aeneus]
MGFKNRFLCVIGISCLCFNIILTQDVTTNKIKNAPEESPKEQPVQGNITSNSTSTNSTVKYVQCLPNLGSEKVQLVNDTELIKLLSPDTNITSRETPAPCILVLFYSKYCPFSSMAAPHFNALPRAFPDIKMVAINAMVYHLFNTQNGIVGVPSILLFHNGRPVAKYNDSKYTLELFSKVLTGITGLNPTELNWVSSADFEGPVYSVPSKDSDTFLIMSWIFVNLCMAYYFTKTTWWSKICETVQKYWRESEQHAEHEHEHLD